MTVDEAKYLLGLETDKQLAFLTDRKKSAVYFWRKNGKIPDSVEKLVYNGNLEERKKDMPKAGTYTKSNPDPNYKRMSVEEAKRLLCIRSDLNLARTIGRNPSAVSLWRKMGHLGYDAENIVRKLVAGEVICTVGTSNYTEEQEPSEKTPETLQPRPQETSEYSPELEIIKNMTETWNRKKLRRLLREALVIDEETI